MVASNARKNFGFLHISFYKVVQIVLPIIVFNTFCTMKNLVYGIGCTLSGIALVSVSLEFFEGFLCFTNVCIGGMLTIVGILNLINLFFGNNQEENEK